MFARFSPDGKWIASTGQYDGNIEVYFVSDRSFNPMLSQTELDHSYSDMAKIYFVTLAKETKSPFEPKSDEVKIKEPGKESEKSDKKKDEKGETKPPAKVDVDGLQQRIARLPVIAASYRNLTSVGDKLFYVRSRSKDEKAKFFFYDLEKQKETDLAGSTDMKYLPMGRRPLSVRRAHTQSLIFLRIVSIVCAKGLPW